MAVFPSTMKKGMTASNAMPKGPSKGNVNAKKDAPVDKMKGKKSAPKKAKMGAKSMPFFGKSK